MTITWKNAEGLFKHLKAVELKELDDEQKVAYKEAETEYNISKYEELDALAEKTAAQTEELKELQTSLLKLSTEQFKAMQTQMKEMQEKLVNHKAAGEKPDLTPFKEAIKDFEDASVFMTKLSSKDGLSIKADATYTDLTQTGQLNQVQAGISDVVKKRVTLPQLFKRIPMNTEIYSYLQQKDTVARNAQNVALCTKGFNSLTKEEIEVVDIKYVKIKDYANLCLDYMDDYDYVEARYNVLLNDSLTFKIDTDILLGTNTPLSMNSIDAVSSEFSSVNPDAFIGPNIDDANVSDLALGMACQIDVLGKLASFMANVVIVNKLDWYTKIETKKDTQGRYLDPRVSVINGNYFIGDLLVIPHVDVVTNTMYVLDTTRGAILDRKQVALKKSTENGTNFIDEFITLMITAKLQFLVEENNHNAFMKCSNVDLAVDSITLP